MSWHVIFSGCIGQGHLRGLSLCDGIFEKGVSQYMYAEYNALAKKAYCIPNTMHLQKHIMC